MKKLFTAVVALVICLSLTLTSFAAVTIGGTFTDGTDVYVYGTFEGEATEVGVKVGERTYPLSEKKMFQANKYRKFVIGLRDAMNILGLEFDVVPYAVSDGNETTGEAVKAKKEVLESITAVTVGGKMVSEFYQGTNETEFYYGLDAIPEAAEELPAVAVKAGTHEFELKTEAEIGGWAVTAYHEGAKLVTVHFRKFAEITTAAYPKIHYQARNHYIDTSMSADITDSVTQSFFFRTKGESIYDDAESALGYTYYDVEAVEGYAPVAYTVSGVYVSKKAECTEGVSVWNYDGDLSDETFTSIADIVAAYAAEEEYHNPALYFKGFNPIEEYKVALISTQEQIITSFDSTTVKEGGNFIIMKNETTDNSWAGFYMDKTNYPWRMTVKYVEKNPVDETLQDASLAEIKVGDTVVSGVNAETKVYYYGVDDVYGELPEVTATASQAAKGATVSIEKGIETKITVTAADGVTKETYTLNFRPLKKATINPTAVIRSNGAFKAINFTGGYVNLYSKVPVLNGLAGDVNGYSGYFLYNKGLSDDVVIVGAEMSAVLNSAAGTVELYQFCETDPVTAKVTSMDSLIDKDNNAFLSTISGTLDYHTGLEDAYDTWKLGEASLDAASDSKKTVITVLDHSKLKFTDDGYTVLVAKKKYIADDSNSASTTNLWNSAITLSYVEKAFVDARDTDATLSSIKINGEEIEGFSSDVTEYYYPVESLESIPEDIVAVATQESRGATAEIAEYDEATGNLTITGTSANGTETQDYLIKFRKIITSDPISYHSLAASRASELKYSSNWFGTKEHVELYYNYIEAYMAYQLPVAENIRIISASLNNAEARWYNVADDTIEIYQSSLDFDTIYADGKFVGDDVVSSGNYVANSDEYKLASYTITSESTTANTKYITKYVGDNGVMPLDVSKLKVYDGGVVIIYAENTNSERRPYLPGTLSVEYIICD